MRSQVALALALALVALRQCPTHAAKTLANPFQPDNDLPCACSDIDPRSFFTRLTHFHLVILAGGCDCELLGASHIWAVRAAVHV